MGNQRGLGNQIKSQSISTPSLGLTPNASSNFSNGTYLPTNVNKSMTNISIGKSKKKKKNHNEKKKLTANDIGSPFDFR